MLQTQTIRSPRAARLLLPLARRTALQTNLRKYHATTIPTLRIIPHSFQRNCPISASFVMKFKNGTMMTTSQQQQQYKATLSSKKAACPFRTLQVSKESTYSEIKKKFLKIAMSHHPDVLSKDTDHMTKKEKDDRIQHYTSLFIKARSAFDAIVETDDGMCALRKDVEGKKEKHMTDDEFDAWFLNETGHNSPFQVNLDPATLREVSDMTEKMGGGLDRDGGMWQLAAMVSESVKSGKGNALRLESGAVKETEESFNGSLRYRRRKRNN